MLSAIRSTYILIAVLTALLLSFGWYLGGIDGALIALFFATIFNFVSYWSCGTLALKFYKAKEAKEDKYPIIHKMLKSLAERAEIPKPALYIIDTTQPNAFATGRNPNKGVVALSRSLIEVLDNDELEGVIAHEIAHIKNRDTLIMSVTATIAGAIGLLANFVYLMIGRNKEGAENPIATFIIVVLAPAIAFLIQMSISRVREYEADRISAELTEKPLALCLALYKLQYGAEKIYNIRAQRNPGTAHMFIINPLRKSFISRIFSTHPSSEERIKRLIAIYENKNGPLPKSLDYIKKLYNKKKPWYKKYSKTSN